MNQKVIVVAFRKHLERLGYSKNSVLMLPNLLNDFLTFTNKNYKEIEQEDILSFRAHLQQRPNKRRAGGLSESYITHHIYSIKIFYQWQQEKRNILINPASSLVFKSPKSKEREILSQEEIKQLYQVSETLKEKALLSVFYGCGLRRSEGENLDLKDVKFRTGILYVRKGKNSKRRAVPMSKKVNQDLQHYVYKTRFSVENETAFFTNNNGERMKGQTHSRALKQLLNRTLISKQISLHNLRHSIASHLLEQGLSVEYVREFLGHKHLETTQIYTRINNKNLWNLNST